MKKHVFVLNSIRVIIYRVSALLVLVSLSCKPVQELKPPQVATSAAFDVVDGRIRFDDVTALSAFMKTFRERYPVNKLEDWNNKLVGVTSLFKMQLDGKSIYAQQGAGARGSVEPVDGEFSELIEDVYLKSLFNDKGEMMLGNMIVRLTKDVVFMYRKEKQAVVDNFESAKWESHLSSTTKFVEVENGVLVGKIRRHIFRTVKQGRLGGLPYADDHDLHYFNSTDRFVTNVWNSSYIVFSSMGAKVEHQNHRWYGWVDSNTTALNLLSTVWFSNPVSPGGPVYPLYFQDGPCSDCHIEERSQFQSGTYIDGQYLPADQFDLVKFEATGYCAAGSASYTGYAHVGN